jgi:hypothetical protein
MKRQRTNHQESDNKSYPAREQQLANEQYSLRLNFMYKTNENQKAQNPKTPKQSMLKYVLAVFFLDYHS